MIDALLDAFRFVANWNQRASIVNSVGVALFNASVLVEFVVVRLDVVDNDSPLALDVDGAQRLDVGSGAWAQVGLLFQFLQKVHRVLGIGDNVLVEAQHGIVVLVESVDHIVGRVVGIFETPGLGGVLGAFRDFGLVFLGIRSFVVGWWMTIGSSSHNSYYTNAQKYLRYVSFRYL